MTTTTLPPSCVKAVSRPTITSVEIMSSLLRGDTQFAFPTAGTGVPQVQGGKLRALAVTSPKRLPQLPDVPTLEEVLKSKLAVQESWSGLWAPAGVPPDVLTRLNAAVNKVLAMPEVKQKLVAVGAEVAGGTPEQFAALIKSEGSTWKGVIERTGIKPD